jgi:protein-tyrosine kinase
MTKIFEALQQQPREEVRVLTRFPETTRLTPSEKKPVFTLEEAMIRLYQGLENALPGPGSKLLLFVASCLGEGSSTMVRELARVVSEKFGKAVLVLDADPDHPTQHLFLGVTPLHYLEEVLKKGLALETAIYRTRNGGTAVSLLSKNRKMIPELIDSLEIDDLLKQLKGSFDFVLIDSSPVTDSSEALAISRKVDGVVMVVEAETTRWPVAENTRQQIQKNGGNILGVVFNKRKFYIPKSIYKRL